MSICHDYMTDAEGVVDVGERIVYPYDGRASYLWVEPTQLPPAASPGGPQCIGWYPFAIPIDGGDPRACAL